MASTAERVDVMAGDAFAGLMQLIEARRKFNLVIVDPPAFANSRANMGNAVLAYRRLAEMALRLLANDGLLVMASCSSRIKAEKFLPAGGAHGGGVGLPAGDHREDRARAGSSGGFPGGGLFEGAFRAAAGVAHMRARAILPP